MYNAHLADVRSRRAERLASTLNHLGQGLNDLACLVLLSLSSLLIAAGAGLAEVESQWRDVAGQPSENKGGVCVR